jgi:cupin 2 domain-containing protein
MNNLFQGMPADLPQEFMEDLFMHRGLRVQRILSRGHADPPGQWQQQDQDEWVLLIQGEAELEYREPPRKQRLTGGDWIFIPAGEAHRVAWTPPDRDTLWLALHWDAPG